MVKADQYRLDERSSYVQIALKQVAGIGTIKALSIETQGVSRTLTRISVQHPTVLDASVRAVRLALSQMRRFCLTGETGSCGHVTTLSKQYRLFERPIS